MTNIPLGKETPQPNTYSPQSLAPIKRALGRMSLSREILNEMIGYDIWTFWECSWLDMDGVPQQAPVQMKIPAHSENIIESKSLKLYLNSLNNYLIGEEEELLAILTRDLSKVLELQPELRVLQPQDLQRHIPEGICIDDKRKGLKKRYTHKERLQALSLCELEEGSFYSHTRYSHLFRSLCPVTAQPDFALVYTRYNSIAHQELLNYWLSFRNHQGFHEQCVEQMFCDFYSYGKEMGEEGRDLIVGGAFTRRGGLDIHPVRYHRAHTCEHRPINYTFVQ